MNQEKKTCNNCIHLKVCNYYNPVRDLVSTNHAYTRCEHLLWNKASEDLKTVMARNCKHYIDNSYNVQLLLNKIEKSKDSLKWLENYMSRYKDRSDLEHLIECAIKNCRESLEKLEGNQ
tara:strand:- start:1563 stop:1919 length:357 start_codon:yes stop_codon:yes gene_type:complete